MDKINKKELKITIKKFLNASKRMMNSDYRMYANELDKFLKAIENDHIIFDYIKNCGEANISPKEEYEAVSKSFGRAIFGFGETKEKETAEIYKMLKYFVEIKLNGADFMFLGYQNGSKKYQDMVENFNRKYIGRMVDNIQEYLALLCIEKENEEDLIKNDNNIIIENSDFSNATLQIGKNNVNTNTGIKARELGEIINKIIEESKTFNEEDKELIIESLDTIKENINKDSKKNILSFAIKTLQKIKGSVEFVAAVATLSNLIKI